MKLEIGYNTTFEVRHQQYSAGIGSAFSILYLSDFHFNKHSHAFTVKLIERINELNPDIILFGGDYADSNRGLFFLNMLLESLHKHKAILAIAGNHDYFLGIEAIKKIMKTNYVQWIENSSYTLIINNCTVQIDGNKPSMQITQADFSILCLHKPISIKKYSNKYNIVFAGHLHGCQFVFWKKDQALYPGKLFYQWNILQKQEDGCYYFISKGLGDTLPIRFNCVKDMIFVEVEGKKI